MRHEFKLQDPGEGVHEVEIQEILISEGDEVAEGDDVLLVESDKAAIELPSPYSGRVVEIRVGTGDIAEVGDVLLVVDDQEDAAEEKPADGGSGASDPTDEDTDTQAGGESRDDDRGRPAGSGQERDEDEAAEEGKPVECGAAKKRGPAKTADEGDHATDRAQDAASGNGDDERPVPAAPAARRIAEEKGIDLAEVEPGGRDGQVLVADVRAALGEAEEDRREQDKDRAADSGDASRENEEGDRDAFGPTERLPLRSIRAATARAMARAWSDIPHVVHQDLADVTELERWRLKLNREDDSGAPLTLTAFLIKAAAALLQRHPRFNARLDADAGEIVLCRYYNINVAVAADRGLLTPVLRGADRKSVRAIAEELADLSERMRSGRPSKQDLAGGTFTITNVGGIGGTAFSPIINPPQSAIFGFGRAELAPVVRGTLEAIDEAETEVRLMLPVILAFDHRLIDGADAARFVNDFREMIASVRNFAVEV